MASLAIEGGAAISAAALAVEAIDTVGAGDTFCGYLAAALAEGQPLEKALAISRRRRQPRLHEIRRAAVDSATEARSKQRC